MVEAKQGLGISGLISSEAATLNSLIRCYHYRIVKKPQVLLEEFDL